MKVQNEVGMSGNGMQPHVQRFGFHLWLKSLLGNPTGLNSQN